MKRHLTCFFCCLLLCAPAWSDVVHLKDGRKVEGTVVEQTDQKVVVQTKFGVNEFKASDVARVEKKATPEEEFKARREAADGDAAKLYELYLWAKAQGLKSEPSRVLRDVIKVDPEHENARKLLGYEKYEGEWLTEKELEKRKAEAERKDKEAKGLVLYKGEWIEPAEKEKRENEAKGLTLIDGEWVNKKDIERKQKEAERSRLRAENLAKGLYEVEGKWVPKSEAEAYYADLNNPYVAEGEHIQLHTNNGIDFGDKMLIEAEAAYRRTREFFGMEPNLNGGKFHVFVTRNLEDYNRLGNNFNADEQSSNFYVFASPWLGDNEQGIDLVTVTQFNTSNDLTAVYVAHATAEQFVRRLIGPTAADPAPRWFIDGVSAYISRFQNTNYYGWSRNRLIETGGVLKLKTHFGSYLPHEQQILGGGILVAWLKSDRCPEEVQKELADCVVAVTEGKKVQKAFRSLEKLLLKNEDAFRDFAEL